MSSVDKNSWSFESGARPPHSPLAASALLKILPFLIIGAVGSIAGAWLVFIHGVNLVVVCMAMLFGLPAIWCAWVGTIELWRVLLRFRTKLRWWHWLWFLSVASSFVFRYRSASEITQNPFDALAALRVGPEVIVGIIVVGCLVFRKPDWGGSMLRGVIGTTAAFGFVCLVSSLWSVRFSWTFYKSLEYLLDLSVIAVVLVAITNSREYKTLIDWTWIIAGLTVLWVWIGLPIWPDLSWAEESRLAGAYPIVSSDELGDTGAILLLVALIRLWPLAGTCKNRAFYLLIAAAGVLTMIAAQTRSAFAGFAVGVLLVLFLAGRKRYAIWGSIIALPAVLFTSLGPRILTFLQRDQSEAEFMSMSSRLDWWAIGWKTFMQHPLTGLGAYAGSRFAVLSAVGAPQLHSDWMEILVGTSIWGLAPFVISLVWIWLILVAGFRRRGLDVVDRQVTLEIIGVLTIITIHSFVNVEMTWHHPTPFLMILGWAEFLRRKLKRPLASIPALTFRAGPSVMGAPARTGT